jgi:hypothetical protein
VEQQHHPRRDAAVACLVVIVVVAVVVVLAGLWAASTFDMDSSHRVLPLVAAVRWYPPSPTARPPGRGRTVDNERRSDHRSVKFVDNPIASDPAGP